MPKLLTTWILSSASLAIAAQLLGDHMDIGDSGDSTTARVISIAIVGAIFAVINTYVAPVIKTLSLPFIIISLGLALLVINALLLLLTDWITGKFDVPFFVDGFWWAVLGAVVISLVNTVLGAFTNKK
ncbi:phage holin family protein [Aeromicrobium sp.]|uniref:phage holin family protein n=1 Tax=Aeromicrobium sp. TaxID=1871063 RepID=UPI002FCA56CD